MASNNKRFRETISGFESLLNRIISREDVIQDEKQELQNRINFLCSYECYFFDCGLFCPDGCPVLELHRRLEKLQLEEENEELKNLGFVNKK